VKDQIPANDNSARRHAPLRWLLTIASLTLGNLAWCAGPLVMQSDFGVRDGAVAAMKGVAVSVSPQLAIFDLTHEIPAFNVWEASLRLAQTARYWPEGTVFVSVVDPGVGTERKSIVLKTRSGHYFVSPDNGSLTSVAEQLGIEAVREIDESVNRLAHSENSHTFHGRDVYAYTGARLAAGIITFAEVGPVLPARVKMIPYQQPRYEQGGLYGNIEILDPQFGNVWTNIDSATFQKLNLQTGDEVSIVISNEDGIVLKQKLPYGSTFGVVAVGAPLLYLNSLGKVALAINQGSYAATFHIGSGAGWNIEIRK